MSDKRYVWTGGPEIISHHETLECVDMNLPIIAELDPGVYLVAHPNGLGVATATQLSTLTAKGLKRPIRDAAIRVLQQIDGWEKLRPTIFKAEVKNEGTP